VTIAVWIINDMTTVAFVSVLVNTIKQWSDQFDNHGWYAVMLVLVLTIDEHVRPAWWLQLNLAASVTRSYDLIWLDGWKSHRVFGLANTASDRRAVSTDSLVRCNLLSSQAANSHCGLAKSHFCLQEMLRDQNRRTLLLLIYNSTVVNICTASFLILQNSKFSNGVYFVWFSEKLTVISLHSDIKLVFMT
jgi:hypothetical protein